MTNRQRKPVGISVDHELWGLFQMLHSNASRRVRALIMWDLKQSKRKGQLDLLLSIHDNDPELKKLIDRVPD